MIPSAREAGTPVPLDDWTAEIRTHLAGAPEETCIIYLRRAAQQFCEDSRIWRELLGEHAVSPAASNALTVDVVVPEEDTYPLPSGGGVDSVLIGIDRLEIDGLPLRPLDRRRRVAYDEWTKMLHIDATLITRAGVLGIYALLRPSDAATALPEALAKWRSGIIDRALERMMLMPKQPWSNPVLARRFAGQYQNRVSEARRAAARGNVSNRSSRKGVPPRELV